MADPPTLAQNAMTLISSLGAAVSAWAAWQATKVSKETAIEGAESNRLAEETRLANLRPHVVAYARSDVENGNGKILSLYIHNVGPGAARNVRFHLSKGGDFQTISQEPLSEWGPLKQGLSVLASQEKIQTLLVSRLLPNWSEISETDIYIEIEYMSIEGKFYKPERFILNLKVMDNTVWTGASTNDPEIVRNRHLENIATNLRSITQRR